MSILHQTSFNPKEPHIIIEGGVYYKLGELNNGIINYDFPKILTYLNARELEGLYGNRVRSRMREMLNVIAFPRDSPDKRT